MAAPSRHFSDGKGMAAHLPGIEPGDNALDYLREQERRRGASARRWSGHYAERSNRMDLYNLSVADLASVVPAGSVDLIWTDPPYPKEYLPVWADLAAFAHHALREGGTLLALSGSMYLPEIMGMLGKALDYHWLISYRMPGPSTRIFPRSIMERQKPILWYQKGKYVGEWQASEVASPQSDNHDHHHWGQSLDGISFVLARFSAPGDLVCDPFLGGGTTAVAARRLGCAFIGADIEESCVERTRARLADIRTHIA